ncbi:MAG: sensor histidine kinase [Flavobacteriales bacterium]|nr:sensor histidine kinase [Flavobacteriales bacterium]MCB9193890.1 sensor histidine kinase [Flavobacteriales bacterium]
MRTTRFALLVLCLSLWLPIHASKQEDGAKAVLKGHASASERAWALMDLSSALQDTRPGESLENARTALLFAQRTDDLQLLHTVQRRIRDLEHRFGAEDNFLGSAIAAMHTAQQMGDQRAMAEDIEAIADAYRSIGQTNKAVEEGYRAMLLYQRTGDSLAVARARVAMVPDLAAAGKYKEAMEMGRSAQLVLEATGKTDDVAETWLVMGETLVQQERYGDALPCLMKAWERFRASPDAGLRARTLIGTITCDLEIGQIAAAVKAMQELQVLVAGRDQRVFRPRYFELRSRLSAMQGNASMALQQLRTAVQLRDSTMNAQVARRMAGLQALYQLNNKERDNSLLRQRNAMNEAIILGERRRNRMMWVAVVVLMVTLVMLGVTASSKVRTLRRIRLKNAIIRRQSDEIHAKNLELERQNARLAESLLSEEEKDLLLREIHHRVKNDLQIVNALMRLQTAFLDDPQVDSALEDCQRRVGTMALVHDQLYRSHDLKHVGLSDHIRSLALNVLKAFSLEKEVRLEIDVTVPELTTQELVPMGLILNELLTNTAKHAFAQDRSGSLQIGLHADTDGYVFSYSDDGTWPAGDRPYRTGTFGFELMQALAGQLDGHITVLRGERTVFELHFGAQGPALKVAS